MQMKDVVDQALVANGYEFTDQNTRGRYLGTVVAKRPQFLKDYRGKWRRVSDVLEKALQHAPCANAVVNADPVAATPTSEVLGPTPETTPREAINRKGGPRCDRQRKKQKSSAGFSKSAPRLSLERMLIVLESVLESPILSQAAEKAGIHRKTLAYWLKCSKAGHEGYDLVWRDIPGRFHEHCIIAIEAAADEVWEIVLQRGLGVKYPGYEAYVTPPDLKMLRLFLEWKLPEVYGKRRKVRGTQRGGVLIVGQPAKRRKYNTASSVKVRQWKSLSKKIANAMD
jgi:hypothetical protein